MDIGLAQLLGHPLMDLIDHFISWISLEQCYVHIFKTQLYPELFDAHEFTCIKRFQMQPVRFVYNFVQNYIFKDVCVDLNCVSCFIPPEKNQGLLQGDINWTITVGQ